MVKILKNRKSLLKLENEKFYMIYFLPQKDEDSLRAFKDFAYKRHNYKFFFVTNKKLFG